MFLLWRKLQCNVLVERYTVEKSLLKQATINTKPVKRVSILICALLFACHKQPTQVVYDSHLFVELAAHTWIFDSDKIVRANNSDTTIYSTDTAQQTATFNSQQYIFRTVADTMALDSALYQITYDAPNKIYYYNMSTPLLAKQFFTIDTVNNSHLILQGNDTVNLSSLIYYHAQ